MKTALITGCNGGLGQRLLTRFASLGYNVIACSISEDDAFLKKCSEFEKEYGIADWESPNLENNNPKSEEETPKTEQIFPKMSIEIDNIDNIDIKNINKPKQTFANDTVWNDSMAKELGF